MTWADYLILAIILVSAFIGLLRGFLREIVSLIVWVAGFWAALSFAHAVGENFGFIHSAAGRVITGFVLVFVLALLVGAVLNFLVQKLVSKTGVGVGDRALGALFGVTRGVVLVAVLVLIGSLTLLPRHAWWRESYFIRYLQPVAGWLRGVIPEKLDADLRRQAGRPPGAFPAAGD